MGSAYHKAYYRPPSPPTYSVSLSKLVWVDYDGVQLLHKSHQPTSNIQQCFPLMWHRYSSKQGTECDDRASSNHLLTPPEPTTPSYTLGTETKT